MSSIIVAVMLGLALAAVSGAYWKLLREHQQLRGRHRKLRRRQKRQQIRFHELYHSRSQLRAHLDQNHNALMRAWLIVFWLLRRNENLLQALTLVWNQRMSLKRELTGTGKASAAHRRNHEGAERKIELLMALAIDLQVKLSTMHALRVQARRKLVEEFIRRVLELLAAGKPN